MSSTWKEICFVLRVEVVALDLVLKRHSRTLVRLCCQLQNVFKTAGYVHLYISIILSWKKSVN